MTTKRVCKAPVNNKTTTVNNGNVARQVTRSMDLLQEEHLELVTELEVFTFF